MFVNKREFWLNDRNVVMKSELKTRSLKNLADAYSSKELRVNEE
jgi:hypothetical protein